jgi:hypothetical protein
MRRKLCEDRFVTRANETVRVSCQSAQSKIHENPSIENIEKKMIHFLSNLRKTSNGKRSTPVSRGIVKQLFEKEEGDKYFRPFVLCRQLQERNLEQRVEYVWAEMENVFVVHFLVFWTCCFARGTRRCCHGPNELAITITEKLV